MRSSNEIRHKERGSSFLTRFGAGGVLETRYVPNVKSTAGESRRDELVSVPYRFGVAERRAGLRSLGVTAGRDRRRVFIDSRPMGQVRTDAGLRDVAGLNCIAQVLTAGADAGEPCGDSRPEPGRDTRAVSARGGENPVVRDQRAAEGVTGTEPSCLGLSALATSRALSHVPARCSLTTAYYTTPLGGTERQRPAGNKAHAGRIGRLVSRLSERSVLGRQELSNRAGAHC